jgi:hypothetical protein
MRFLFVVSNLRDGDLYYTFPLGIAYLASVLEADGVTVDILDLDITPRPISYVEGYISSTRFDCVGDSAENEYVKMTYLKLRNRLKVRYVILT